MYKDQLSKIFQSISKDTQTSLSRYRWSVQELEILWNNRNDIVSDLYGIYGGKFSTSNIEHMRRKLRTAIMGTDYVSEQKPRGAGATNMWSSEELRVLSMGFAVYPLPALCEKLNNRSPKAVVRKAHELNLW